ncbi:uncharacterized protein ARMOST_21693 [Armillaria ostoyae]|uniref:Uncharacterized protein n=1 Tax=Armillaria ostoyae TaxID=47428 RepID=A0A284SAT2_ARMOS|nr:uncharacterized protein ARMOST_21693 [Armillaria ostoyae]
MYCSDSKIKESRAARNDWVELRAALYGRRDRILGCSDGEADVYGEWNVSRASENTAKTLDNVVGEDYAAYAIVMAVINLLSIENGS